MNIRKTLLVTFISAVIVLVSAPGAVVAGSSVAYDGCDTTLMPLHSPVSSCCESGNCLAICCSVPETPSDKAVVSYLPPPNKNFVVVLYNSTEPIEITFAFDKPLKQDNSQSYSFHLPGEYHCRSNLNSEDSFHI